MVYFIIGDVDSGKSTKFLSMFKEQKEQIGLYAKKLYNECNTIVGYNLVLLPECKEIPFAKIKGSDSNQSEEEFYFRGRFTFSQKAFKIGESYILDNIKGDTVWIDEIGGLEMNGLGYDSLLKTLLDRNINLVLTVRKYLFKSIVERYYIKDYLVII